MDGPLGVVADLLGVGGPSGNDHESSNWAAWGHEEIRSMLDTSVDPGDVGEAAGAWREQGRNMADVITGLTRDLNGIVIGGWRGASADTALTALPPIDQWLASVADTADRTTALMDASGSSAAQAKAAVPPPKPHDWGESLLSLAAGGPAGAVIDAVAQEQEQSDAHAEAVRIMTNVYSAPINDHSVAVPTYPQLVDPTTQPPDQPPDTGPASATVYSGTAGSSGTPRSSGTAGPGAGVGGHGGGHVAHSPPPAAATLQGVTSGGAGLVPHGVQVAPDQVPRRPQHVGGQAAAAAAGTPIMAPIAGGDPGVARAAGGWVRLGGGRSGGYPSGSGQVSGAGAGHTVEFGPRPSGAAAEIAEGRAGGLGRCASAVAGRAGAGELMPPMAGGRGKGGEDSEHRRPSYLIEMDDIFTDGRKVAPAVIGDDLPEQDG
jgi:PPE family protein